MRRTSLLSLLLALLLLEANCTQSQHPGTKACTIPNAEYQCESGFVCVNSTCANCQRDSQCSAQLVCNLAKGLCQHKEIFPDFDWTDIVGTILGVVVCFLAAGGGIGGGGLLVPVFIIFCNFPAKQAIPLSKGTIFGGALANQILNYSKRHPRGTRPLIDFQAALLFEPLVLVGTVGGVVINKILPEWLLLILLLIVLFFTSYTALAKGVALYQVESYQAVPQDLLLSSPPQDEVRHPELRAILAQESKQQHWSVHLSLFFFLLLVVGLSLLRGGEHGFQSIVGCGSVWYWVLLLILIPIVGLMTFVNARKLVALHQRKLSLKYPFHDGDIHWTTWTSLLYPLLITTAGLGSAGLGIGGGMITGPFLLHLGMQPQVVAATSAYMILFTSAATSAQFLILGAMPLGYLAWYALLGFVATFAGQLVTNYYVKAHGRVSYIALLIGLVVALSAVFLGVNSVITLSKQVYHGRYLGPGSLC